uniref:receptor protein-tyrosine kinase n=1 Tax=Crassostrea virginica TaxID=6565 RepID=A0A8B8EA62_CRAVI|nr:vascular endothelial growth factor receptor 2-like isoform X2 [Crassostrea virginica]
MKTMNTFKLVFLCGTLVTSSGYNTADGGRILNDLCKAKCYLKSNDSNTCLSKCSSQSVLSNESFPMLGTLNYSAIDTCAFNKPPSGNISNTYNIFLKWDYGLYETDISMYTIWRLMKFESFFEKEWQLIASIVPVSNEDVFLPTQETRWVQSLREGAIVQQPLSITVSNETIIGKNVKVLLSWKPPQERPCFYKVFWMSANCGTHKSRVIDLSTIQGPSVWISRLGFGCDYKFDIQSSADPYFITVSDFTVTSYSTIDCLSATFHNYSLCAPEPPSEMSVRTVETYVDTVHNMSAGDILLSWKPPSNVSLRNQIDLYRVKFRKVAPLHHLKYLIPHVNFTDVPGNQTWVVLKKMHWFNDYRFSISAISSGGESKDCTKTFKLGEFYELTSTEEPIKVVDDQTEAVIAVTVVVLAIFVAFIIICVVKRRRGLQDENERKTSDEALNPLYVATPHSSCQDPLLIDDMEICFENLQLLEVIGEGAFGKVHKGEYFQKNGKICTVAVKMLKEFADKTEEKSLLTEIDAMKQLGYHPNIVGMLGYCTKPSFLCLIMDFCPLGDLRHYLLNCRHQMMKTGQRVTRGSDSGISPGCDRRGDLSFFSQGLDGAEEDASSALSDTVGRESESCIHETTLLSYARQIAIGMEFLSQKKFIHRDLAARNILMVDNRRLKISDFGLTRDIYETNMYQPTSSRKLPYKWMAIESIFDQIFTIKSDVWSFGIVLWEIVTLGGSPYPGIPNEDLFRLLKDGYRMDQPENCSTDIYQMMLSAWHPHADCRPTFSDLRQKLESMLEATKSYINLSVNVSQDYYTNDNSSRDSSPSSVQDSVTDSTGSRSSYLVMNIQGETNPSPVIPNTYLSLPQNIVSNSYTEYKPVCTHGQDSGCVYVTEQCDMCRSLPCPLCNTGNKQKPDVIHSMTSLKDITQLSEEVQNQESDNANGYLDKSNMEVKADSDIQTHIPIST